MNIQNIKTSKDKNVLMSVSPVCASFFRFLNGNLNDTQRQELNQYLPKLLDTIPTQDVELKRVCFLVNAAVKVFAVNALKKAGLTAEANKLLALSDIVDQKTVQAAAQAVESTAQAAWVAEAVWAAEAAKTARAVWVAESAAKVADATIATVSAEVVFWAAWASRYADTTLVHNVIKQLVEIK